MDTVENLILGTEPNYPLSSYMGLEIHHPIMSMLGGHRGWLGIERERYRERERERERDGCSTWKTFQEGKFTLVRKKIVVVAMIVNTSRSRMVRSTSPLTSL